MDAKGDSINLDLSQLTGEIVAAVDEEQKSKPGLLPTSPAAAKEWLSQKKQSIRPWKQFVNFNRFSVPKNIGDASARVVQNVEHFQSNYLFVFIGLILYCILTSPLLLIAIVAGMGGAYIIRLKSAEGKIKLFSEFFFYFFHFIAFIMSHRCDQSLTKGMSRNTVLVLKVSLQSRDAWIPCLEGIWSFEQLW